MVLQPVRVQVLERMAQEVEGRRQREKSRGLGGHLHPFDEHSG